jgi:DNA repair exonuclease SbcCD ATPase subunit
MGSFKRALFGYRRPDVDEAIASHETRIRGLQKRAGACEAESQRRAVLIGELERESVTLASAVAELERETSALSGMVIEREREIRDLVDRLQEANARHERSIGSLDAVSERLDEIQAQARGQATRIRMKALREAVEVSRRVQALTAAHGEGAEANGATDAPLSEPTFGLFEGEVKVEIGPLGDFAQLVGFEDAVGQLGASEISVERFSEGRATLSMHLDEPTELLRELEELSELDFRVRHTAPDNLILDVDEDSGEQRAA